MMKKEKILVTGAAGFVGSLLVDQLLYADYDVVGFDNFFRHHNNSLIRPSFNHKFSFIQGDVTKPEDVKRAVNQCDAIVHLAALVGEPICERFRNLAHSVNIDGCINILNYRQGKPLVFASTGSVYGKLDETCTELSPTNPLSVYGVTKLLAEECVRAENGTISLRFATGMGSSPNIRYDLLTNSFVKEAVWNKSIVVYQPEARRTFIHVADMGCAIRKCLTKLLANPHEAGKVYNCGANSLNITKRDLAILIKGATGCDLFWGTNGYVDPDKRDYEVDYSKFAEEMDWEPLWGFDATIQHLIKLTKLLGNYGGRSLE